MKSKTFQQNLNERNLTTTSELLEQNLGKQQRSKNQFILS